MFFVFFVNIYMCWQDGVIQGRPFEDDVIQLYRYNALTVHYDEGMLVPSGLLSRFVPHHVGKRCVL